MLLVVIKAVFKAVFSLCTSASYSLYLQIFFNFCPTPILNRSTHVSLVKMHFSAIILPCLLSLARAHPAAEPAPQALTVPPLSTPAFATIEGKSSSPFLLVSI